MTFEYDIVTLPEAAEEIRAVLEVQGRAGWDLVSVLPVRHGWRARQLAYFKRAVR